MSELRRSRSRSGSGRDSGGGRSRGSGRGSNRVELGQRQRELQRRSEQERGEIEEPEQQEGAAAVQLTVPGVLLDDPFVGQQLWVQLQRDWQLLVCGSQLARKHNMDM